MIAFSLAAVLAASTPLPPIDTVVTEASGAGFAGEVLVSTSDKTIYDRAVSAPGRPHKAGDLWRWASVTKQLTATLVMQEVAAGRLSLDDTIAARLPAFNGPTGARVTLRMLLQHTSGLPNPDDTPAADVKSFPAFYLRNSRGVGGAEDATGYCAGKPRAEPGAGFSYNNCDYIVMGAILERTSGKPFATLIRTRIAKPVGMETLRVASADRATPPMTPGVDADGKPEPRFNLATFGPAGAAYGAPEDLARFDRALMGGRLLDADHLTVTWKGDPHLGYVALGAWSFTAKLAGCAAAVDLVERRGEIGGVEVRNLLAPKLGKALVVFADRSDLDFGEIWQANGLSYRLASAAFCAV